MIELGALRIRRRVPRGARGFVIAKALRRALSSRGGLGLVRRLPRPVVPHGESRDLPGSWATHPAPLPYSQLPTGPLVTRRTRREVLPPIPRGRRLQQQHDIEIQSHGFSARFLRFTRAVAGPHARYASGAIASLSGRGSIPLDRLKGFRRSLLHRRSPFSDFAWRKLGPRSPPLLRSPGDRSRAGARRTRLHQKALRGGSLREPCAARPTNRGATTPRRPRAQRRPSVARRGVARRLAEGVSGDEDPRDSGVPI